jgi:hypothetical protein
VLACDQLVWRMNAGIGDTVFSSAYEVLRERRRATSRRRRGSQGLDATKRRVEGAGQAAVTAVATASNKNLRD